MSGRTGSDHSAAAALTLTCCPEAVPSPPSPGSAPLARLYMGADRWSSSAADGSTRDRFGSVLAEFSFSAEHTGRRVRRDNNNNNNNNNNNIY